MENKVYIPHKLMNLNEYIRICRANHKWANHKKQTEENLILDYFSELETIKICEGYKFDFIFTWHCGNRRNDPDNVSFAKKMVLDAMIKAKKLETDGPKIVNGFVDNFVYGGDWGIGLEIKKVKARR